MGGENLDYTDIDIYGYLPIELNQAFPTLAVPEN